MRRLKRKAAALLDEGAIFAFGLSEKEHGADIYATDMLLVPAGDGNYLATGRQVLHRQRQRGGHGLHLRQDCRTAAITSSSSSTASTEVRTGQEHHRQPVLRRRIHACTTTRSPRRTSSRAAMRLGCDAQHRQYRQVQPGLGLASASAPTPSTRRSTTPRGAVCTACMSPISPHVKQMFTDAYARLVAMKLFALRAADYFRSASAGGSPLPALQSDGQDEGDHPG